jgi:hypothetical protein
MSKLRKFLRLDSRDRWLLVKCTALLITSRVGLWILPFRVLWQLLGQRKVENPSKSYEQGIEKISWAVTAVGSTIPALENCLVQALATQYLLRKNGHPASLRIGVAQEDGEFRAHAWVEVDGIIVVGGSRALSRFVPLPPLKEGTR